MDNKTHWAKELDEASALSVSEIKNMILEERICILEGRCKTIDFKMIEFLKTLDLTIEAFDDAISMRLDVLEFRLDRLIGEKKID